MVGAHHQTTRLARGRHRGPQYGVCAMELASLLGHEHFTDHPQQVCPVIAAFLRGYNDAVGDRRRQELFGLAAAVVGSRTDDPALRRERAEALDGWAVAVWRMRRAHLPWPPSFPASIGFAESEAAGAYVGRVARRDARVHARTLEFVERLVAPPSPDRGAGAISPAGDGSAGRAAVMLAGDDRRSPAGRPPARA